MAFLLLILCGFAGGLLGGMGMGGGTALIPFLPMAALALAVHAKAGLLRGRGLFPLVLPALLFSALGSLLAAYLPADALEKGFGVFLIVLALIRLRDGLFARKQTDKK